MTTKYENFESLLNDLTTKQRNRFKRWLSLADDYKLSDQKAQSITGYIARLLGWETSWNGGNTFPQSLDDLGNDFAIRKGYQVLSVAYANYDSNPEDLQDTIDTVDELNSWYVYSASGFSMDSGVWKMNAYTMKRLLNDFQDDIYCDETIDELFN